MMIRERALQWMVNNLKEWPEYMAVEVGAAPYIGDTGCSWVVTWEEFSGGLEKQSTVRVGKHPKFGAISDELRITKKNWMDAKQGKENRMMNREEALQWLASNVKAWPWSKQVLPVIDNPDGWEWVATGGQWKQLVCSDGLITHDDCYCAKPPAQPAQLTRDHALAWLVANVKVWPDSWANTKALKNNDWEWFKEVKKGQFAIFSFCNTKTSADNVIEKQDWQAAQPTPASNKPSWADAPEDAKWLCQDEDGSWGFSVPRPKPDLICWVNKEKADWPKNTAAGKKNPNWRDTLEHRPVSEESAPIDTRKSDSIAVGEALTEAATITPEQVAAIVGDALTLENTNLGVLGRSVLALKRIRADIKITEDKIRAEEANLRALKLGAISLSADIKEALQYFGY